MVSLDVVEMEIRELESRGDTTYAVCERLSWLYVVRDHLAAKQAPEASKVAGVGGSEFLETVSGKDMVDVLAVLDEHMTAQRTFYPKVYEGVMRRLREL